MHRVINHLTLPTGHLARTPRSDVGQEIVDRLRPILKRAESDGPQPLPNFEDYEIEIVKRWDGAAGFAFRGPRGDLATCVAAWGAPGGDLGILWLAGASDRPELPLPYCLVRIEPGCLRDIGAMSWLGDAERCVAWTLIDAARN